MTLTLLIVCVLYTLGNVDAFHTLRPLNQATSALKVNLADLQGDNAQNVVIEVVARKVLDRSELLGKEGGHSTEYVGVVAAYDSVYEEEKEDKMIEIVDSPALKVLSVLLNPSTMVLALYLSSVGWSKVLWVQKFFKIFGKGTLVKREGEAAAKDETDLPFQTFECEKCKMEMRPARGRAEAIFGRARFRCSRCGAKAASYFDVDDLSDPRAVARLERIEKEKNEEWADEDDEEDGDDEYDDDDDE
jgi:hypothetical protein